MRLWVFAFYALSPLLLCSTTFADTQRFERSSRFSPQDYILQSRDNHTDAVFDNYRTVELGAQIGVGADCGKINFEATLKSSLKNVLDTKYFGEVGKDIIAASPMLLTCYFSPTWCAILKHSQINANWMSNMRINQCALMDKYMDSRVEEYYQERQGCVRRSIESNGGNMEQAMESCQGRNMWSADVANWAGGNKDKTGTNKLLDSSAKWAGFNGDDSNRTLDLLKEMVGDTIVSKGNVSVQFGPRNSALTPRIYLQSLQAATYKNLCEGIVKKVEEAGSNTSLDRVVSNDQLKAVSPNTERVLVDKQTVRALMYMGDRQRWAACRKLSDAVAMTVFTTDINRSLDMLTVMSQNPNLPENRKLEIDRKRKALKESVETTVMLQRERNEPINKVLAQINEQGAALQSEAVHEDLTRDSAIERNDILRKEFMNCADGVMCEGR
ncbi:MAG: hypothetical protein AB7F43_09510 [Bacteriovoracia bacterium]